MMTNSRIITFLALLMVLLTSCISKGYDHSAYCEDREVLFCEDFESIQVAVTSMNLGEDRTAVWWIVDNEHLGSYPKEGRSQENLAAFGDFRGGYHSQSAGVLLTPVLNLRNTSAAALHFNLLYDTEHHWDGMIVIASKDFGLTWRILEPEEGYPDSILFEGTLIPGYSGIVLYWDHEVVDLAPVLGSEVMLGFWFGSDQSIEAFGVTLDDIVVEADNQGEETITQLDYELSSPTLDTLELNLILPANPFYNPEIPRANALMDLPCEGEQEYQLKEGQGAYLKAVNRSGDRYLILHPTKGTFCWINQEGVWVDKAEYDLAVLSDKKPEDFYRSVCARTRSPVATDPDCFTSGEVGKVAAHQLSYHLEKVLIRSGEIHMIVLDKGEEPSGEHTGDPRVSSFEKIPDIEPGVEPGGSLTVFVNGVQRSCSFDQLRPGRVVCEDLSLNPADPLSIELCWQGWDEWSQCPPGYAINQEDNSCLILSDLDSCLPGCQEGYQFSAEAGICQLNLEEGELNPDLCPHNFFLNPLADCCMRSDFSEELDCPLGYYYVPETGSCQPWNGEEGTCPEGYRLRKETGICSPEDGQASPVCAAFEAKFPILSITVKETTRCWKGPGNEYEIVSSLKPFTVVDVLGVGEVEGYLVINNPTYQIPCWVAEQDLYLDALDKTILPIIPITTGDGT